MSDALKERLMRLDPDLRAESMAVLGEVADLCAQRDAALAQNAALRKLLDRYVYQDEQDVKHEVLTNSGLYQETKDALSHPDTAAREYTARVRAAALEEAALTVVDAAMKREMFNTDVQPLVDAIRALIADKAEES